MVRGYGMVAVALLVTMLALVGGWSGPANAQENVGGQVIAHFKAEGADVREALRDLFKQVKVSYSIAPEVQGKVTVQLSNVTFEQVLQNVLVQVDATYQIEAGIYMITPRPRITFNGGPRGVGDFIQVPATSIAPVITQDDKFLYILKGDILYKVNKSDLKTVAVRKLGA